MELSFGEQIKILLKRKNMTIRELAESIEIMTGKKMSRQNLTQRLVRDNFQEQDMRMIASVLGCTLRLSLVEGVPEEMPQVVAPKKEAIDIKEAMDHQLTIEDVIRAAGEETLLEEAQENARRKAEEDAAIKAAAEAARKAEAEAAKRAAEEKAAAEVSAKQAEAPKRRVTARDLANRAREDRIRREALLVEQARKEAAERESQARIRGISRMREEERLAEAARNIEKQKLEGEKTEQTAEEKEQIKDIARRALQVTHTSYRRFGPGTLSGREEPEEQPMPTITETIKESAAEEESNESIEALLAEAESDEDAILAAEAEEAAVPEEAEEAAEAPAELSDTDEADEEEETLVDAAKKDLEAKAALSNTADMGVVPASYKRSYADDAAKPAGEINPHTGEEYESNVVRKHPKLTGYIQVYDRGEHKWIDMTEWAFLGFQERKKVLLGAEYKPPILSGIRISGSA